MVNDVLDRIEEYLDQRADADGVPSGGGYRPNEEMRLLSELREARSKRPEGGMSMWLVKFDGKPQAAYSRKVQAEVYAGGFSHPDKIEILEGLFLPQRDGSK